MKKADDMGYRAYAFASPMGKRLYERLGFQMLGSVTAQVEGEDEKLELFCLDYEKEIGEEEET
ncbi:hypothetical protein BU26DRAFT_516224 [Trematosphaeria pertusa]|uniref:N-acetyltransferase domain-containing protein n=1 Tax=Trematosphaeria pertusa TaxID=390896 RepID=A0A6A6ITV3_9PLEO|nr:uncharacterized protein BU26DRAFT_516224 [Trematosphaeria pertusa]KAF2253971.1 hypothetical protein BU26DRAFT_516224 [Trematosphaeria pertusa]